MLRRKLTRIALTALAPLCLGALACDDHGHDHGDHEHTQVNSSALTKAACEQAGIGQVALTASTDPADSTATPILANSGPRTVTLTPDVTNYVWVETVDNHVDTAIFVSVAGVVTQVVASDDASLDMSDQGAPSDCSDKIASDIRMHVDDKGVYRLDLDGSAATSVELLFLDQASAHAHSD